MKQRSEHRSFTIVAQDPTVTDGDGILLSQVVLPFEELDPGPCGSRAQVIDYDASTGTYYWPRSYCESTNPYAHATTDTILEDPHFHAQNAFAIAMQTLHRFEEALGRRVPWTSGVHQLKIAPHAFAQPNAFYSRRGEALLFGYFQSANGPVFTSLSHDIVVHETTHALLDGLRQRYTGASLPDQAAFHEGLSDIVALLSVLAEHALVERILSLEAAPLMPGAGKDTTMLPALVPKSVLDKDSFRTSLLFGLARQMGEELYHARGRPLRSSLELPPSSGYLELPEFQPPHRRGEILVAALMHTYLDVWIGRLRRLAGDGDYVSREWVSEEAANIARELLMLVIRALDYTPPVHLEFSDYLSALLTADYESRGRHGRYDFPGHLRHVFDLYGIMPEAGDTNEGRWHPPDEGDHRIEYGYTRFESLQRDPDEVFRFIWDNRKPLGLKDLAHTRVLSVRPCFRVAPQDGFMVRETVVECLQLMRLTAAELRDVAKLRKPKGLADDDQIDLQGGITLIFNERGRLKYAIAKPLHPAESLTNARRHQERLNRLAEQGWFDPSRRVRTDVEELHRLRMRGSPGFDDDTYLEERWI